VRGHPQVGGAGVEDDVEVLAADSHGAVLLRVGEVGHFDLVRVAAHEFLDVVLHLEGLESVAEVVLGLVELDARLVED
jgi:hypothetical protein